MSTLISRLEVIKDHAQLVAEVQDLIAKVGFKTDQIICQGRSTDQEDWHLGIGSIYDLEHKDEDSYVNIFPSLAGTLIEKYIKRYNGFRTRIMNVQQRHCYSVHRDPTPRIHIPLITNPNCWMVWPFNKDCQRMSAMHSYWTDTTKHHTFMNAGTEPRIHIVMCVSDKEPTALINHLSQNPA